MKKLGILGGMGPLASQLLYGNITKCTQASCDQEHLDILLYSHATLPDRTTAIHQDTTGEVEALLLQDLQLLCTMGAEVLAIPCNTSHYFYDRLASQLDVPLLNMVQLTAQAVAKQGSKKVAILSTEGTQKTKLYETALGEQGIHCHPLPCFIQEQVNYLIYDIVKGGKPMCWTLFAPIDQYIRDQQLDRVILACTELSVYQSHFPLPPLYLDALQVLCEQAILHCGGCLSYPQEVSVCP